MRKAILIKMKQRTSIKLASTIKDIATKYAQDDKLREEIISFSREITKSSKQAIYALHREDSDTANTLLDSASSLIVRTKQLSDDSSLKEVGAFRASLEEFIEAKLFLFFITNNFIPSLEELDLPILIHHETYLLALSDFSGELVRRCVTKATSDDVDSVNHMFSVVEELYGLFLEFDFRTGELRKKFDSMRYNLSKIQTIVYELHLKKG